MMGMICSGVGFLPGVWMKRRLQRALRYGVSRVASRAWSSAKVFGKGRSMVSMTLVGLTGAVGRGAVERGALGCSGFCFTAEDAEHAEGEEGVWLAGGSGSDTEFTEDRESTEGTGRN